MNLPKFITFTGAGEQTDIAGMRELSAKYPIEWGVLFSPSRQGTGRYPNLDVVREIREQGKGLRFAAHLCGGHAREVMATGKLLPDSAEHELRVFLRDCVRVQINTAAADLRLATVIDWASGEGVRAIFQCRDEFPTRGAFSHLVDWLFDASGGRGQEPPAWPKPHSAWHAAYALKGYAGGINPSNVAAVVQILGTDKAEGFSADENYWIDMESGVRDEHDVFDLKLCEDVCRNVYGESAQ